MKVFLVMFNRLTWPKKMCEFLSDTGCEPILIDNNSTYEPLLKWYDEECPYRVYRMNKNWGHLVYWKSGLSENYNDKYFCLSDHDLDLSSIPHDYIDVLKGGLELHPNVTKAGFSLELRDLSDNPFTKEVMDWEGKFWGNKNENGFYNADIDTTFALYSKQRDFGPLPPEGNKFHWAVRSDRPYTIRHLPWYNTKEFVENNEEEKYYNSQTHTYWSTKFKELI